MDLESATVQKALSKKFPRKRCFKEVEDNFIDCLSSLNHPTEKVARTNTDVPAGLTYSTSISSIRNDRPIREYDLGRLRSLSPGSHDPYEGCSRLTDIQYSIELQSELQNGKGHLYGKPCSLVASGRTSNRHDPESGPLSRSLLTSMKYPVPKAGLQREAVIDVKSLNTNSNQITYLPMSDPPNITNYLQPTRTNIPISQSILIRKNSKELQKYQSAPNDITESLPESATVTDRPYPSPPSERRLHPHRRQLNDHSYQHDYLAPLSELPCSSPINYESSFNDTTNLTPMCLRTASTVIIEAMANKICQNRGRKSRSEEFEGDQCVRRYSVNSSPSSSKSSLDSVFSRSQMIYRQRFKNAFQSAHRDLLGGTSLPSSSPVLGEPPELIRISSDDCDYDDDSNSESEGTNVDVEESAATIRREVPDTSCMTVDEILDLIRLPNLSQFTADLDSVKSYLEPHQIGHINHLIKCYADAIFTVSVPPTVFDSKSFSAIDYLDIHMSGVLQIYCIMFKSEDFLSLCVTDQITLLQSCVLPAHMALGFPLYKPDKNAWAIPSAMGSDAPFTYGIHHMLQILPKSEVARLIALHETSHKLNIDWTISVLLLFIFMFTPIKREIIDMENIDSIRNTYVQLLYKYLEWKCGPQNAVVVFPEILKLMDAILRLCQDLEDFELWLKEEEVEIVQRRIKCFNLQGISTFEAGTSEDHSRLLREDPPMDYVSFSSIHSRMSSVLLKGCSTPPTETVSTDPETLLRIPFKMPARNIFLENYQSPKELQNRIRPL